MALDFTFTAEHEAVRDTVRRFCAEEIAPRVREAEEKEAFPRDLFPKWGALGLLGARYPAEDGGSGMDKVSDCIIREEMSFVAQGIASSWSAHSHLSLWPIWRAGTEAQKEGFFRPGLKGEKVGGFGLSEPDGGANIRALKTLSLTGIKEPGMIGVMEPVLGR